MAAFLTIIEALELLKWDHGNLAGSNPIVSAKEVSLSISYFNDNPPRRSSEDRIGLLRKSSKICLCKNLFDLPG